MTDGDDDRPDPAGAAAHAAEEAAAALGEVAGHVQEALLGVVAAARAALDLVERLARDPAPIVQAIRDSVRTDAPTAPTGQPGDHGSPPTEAPSRPRVEHIPVEAADE